MYDSTINRRRVLQAGMAGAASLSVNGLLARAHGGFLARNLSLRIKNPNAPVMDAHMPTPPNVGNEFPPSVITAGGRRWLFIGSNHSVAVEIPLDTHILKDPQCAVRNPAVYSIGGIVHEIRLGRLPVLYDIPPDQYWRHTYCGAFNVDVMPADNRNPEWVFSINHCENKNLSWKRTFTQWFTTNSVNPADAATPSTTSGNWGQDGGFMDYQPAYFGMVSMSWAPVTAETKYGAELFHHDMGPVIWPQTGFMLPDGRKHPDYKNPHNHPSSLIAEDPKDGRSYLYLFANMCSTQPGVHNMIGAARSPIGERGLPGTFKNLYRGEYTEPSLPDTDMRRNIAELRTLKGGKADSIHPSTHGNMNRFFAARLKRSGLFLSVESYRTGDTFETALRLSEDLRTWTERIPIPGTRLDRGSDRKPGAFGLYYPKFLSGDGATHYEIDESQPFSIIATKPHELVYRELEIEIG